MTPANFRPNPEDIMPVDEPEVVDEQAAGDALGLPWAVIGCESRNLHIVQADAPHLRVCFLTSNGPTEERAAHIVRAANSYHALREALEFYANPAIYKAHPHGPAFDGRDLSFVARAVLSISAPHEKE